MAQLAQISMVTGPPTVRDERGSLSGIVFVDVTGRDLAGYVAEAQRVVREQVRLKPGYRLEWGGQFQYLERAKARLRIVKAGDDFSDLRLALHEFSVRHPESDRAAVGAIWGDRGDCVSVLP